MYTQQDKIQIGKQLRKYLVIAGVLLAALIAGDAVGMIQRWEPWVMVDGALIFIAGCFMWLMYIRPCMRYRRFLIDMENGLTREVSGNVVEIAQKEDEQDGVRVYPVRILLESEQDERIVYLNVTKAEQFPKEGAKVRLNCFGRHVKEVALG